ncbi:MAG: hypothetical protein ACK5JU_01685 [Bacteroidales bacterium]
MSNRIIWVSSLKRSDYSFSTVTIGNPEVNIEAAVYTAINPDVHHSFLSRTPEILPLYREKSMEIVRAANSTPRNCYANCSID